MALQVWLPLKGDLNNYGLSNVSITNSGATVDNNGKIGKCYGCKNGSFLLFNYTINTTNIFSFSFWIKVPSTITSAEVWQTMISFSGNNGNNDTNIPINWASYNALKIYDDSNHQAAWLTINYDVWIHFVITNSFHDNKNYIEIYKNGILLNTYLQNLELKIRSGVLSLGLGISSTYGPIYFNDFRIYDHCLSPKEVKEISLGLVLHYKLDEGSFNVNRNLLTDEDLTTWSKEASITCTWDSTVNMYKIADSSHTSSRWGIYKNITLKANTTYTFSVEGMKVDQNVGYGFSEGTSSWPAVAGLFTTTKSRNGRTITVGLSDAVCRIYLFIYPVSEGTNYGYFVAPKLEYGTTMTVPSLTVYDSSGYGNNGTIIGSLTCNSNTPRYNCSTYFDGNSCIITPSGLLSWSNYEYLTIAVWMKPTITPSNYVGSIGIGHDSYNGNKEFAISNYSGKFVVNTTNGSSYVNINSNYVCPLNEWHYYAVTLNETVVKMYVDGSLVKTLTISWGTATNHSSPQFLIGVDLPGTDEKYTGYYSDIRIYTTTLSDQDILNLYQVNASIDNGGNIISNEFEEEYISKQQVLKTGIVKIDNFLETNDKLKVLSDGSVFLLILHHNAPASNLFTANNCWLNNDTNLYSALIMLKNTSWLLNLAEYEFLVCEKLESSSTENQFRWKLTSNPALASTASGYVRIEGTPNYVNNGLANDASTTHGCMDVSGSDWWGCCGAITRHQSGIPGFNGVVKTGYLDLYVKIPNEMIKGNIADFVKFYAKSILTNQLIEK